MKTRTDEDNNRSSESLLSEYLSQTASNLLEPQKSISSSEESEEDNFLSREPFPVMRSPDLEVPSTSKGHDTSTLSTTPSGN